MSQAKKSGESQSAKFQAAARDLDFSNDEACFNAVLRRIAKAAPPTDKHKAGKPKTEKPGQ